uniref:GST N-terminal domain-containing protein n=1 Tax=Globodera rostochiensis TaxID=31243 RepID=A0A914HMF4_GLORO
MQTSKSTSASAKCQQQLQLPRELIYELILCVPSTDWHARRVLLTCSFIYQTILNSKKTQNWKQPVPIMRLPLLPRIHGVSQLTFSQQIVPNMARYFNIIDGTIRSFYCIIKLDHTLFPPGQSQSRLRLSLHSAITAHNFLGPTVEVFYLSNPVESEYDVLRLNFPVALRVNYIGGFLYSALNSLDEAMRAHSSKWPEFAGTATIFWCSEFFYGKAPVLDVDGKQLGQSTAILRFLAEKFVLAGNDEWKKAKTKEIINFQKDANPELAQTFIPNWVTE